MCRARVVLLKSEGVLQLDKTEAEEARLLRESRQKCGCSCIGQCILFSVVFTRGFGSVSG